MTYRIYLHEDIITTLSVFGDLSAVTERIILEALDNDINIELLPKAGDRQGAIRKNITIVNSAIVEYLEGILYDNHAPKSPIRNLLYWFVNEEIYNEWQWTVENNYVEQDNKRKSYLKACEKSLNYLTNEKLKRAMNILKDLLEE